MRAEANFPWVSGVNYGTAPLFFPRATVPLKTFQGSRFKGGISDAWAEGGVARIMESYSKLACKMLLRRIENIERLKEVA